MSRRRQANQGVDRVLSRLEKSVEDGKYYDAFQMYKSVYHRSIVEKRLDDGLKLMLSGARMLLKHKQDDSGTNLALALADHLIEHKTSPTSDLTAAVIEIIQCFQCKGEGRMQFIAKILKWSRQYSTHGDSMLHQACAELYLSEKDYAMCCTHCLYLDLDGIPFASHTLIRVSTMCYKSEISLILAWAVLQYSTMKRLEHAKRLLEHYTNSHPALNKTKYPHQEPLLNFLELYIQAIDRRSPGLIRMLKEKYKKCLDRDPYFGECIDKTLAVYFKEKRPTGGGMGGIGGILQSLMGGMGDMDMSSTPPPQPAPAAVDEDLD